MTNDDILGDSIPSDQQEAMRQFCYQSLKLGAGVGFPFHLKILDLMSCCYCFYNFIAPYSFWIECFL